MRPIRFDEMIPQIGEFTLSCTQKTYRVNPCTIADAEWMKKTYGETIQQRFERVDLGFICTLAIRLMHPEDKVDFALRKVKTMNEMTGAQGEMMLGGSELLKHMVSGHQEILGIIQALQSTIGVSQPLAEDLAQHQLEALKKKAEENLRSAGLESSSASQPTTDGTPSRLSPP